ncbi:response regulator [Belnapia sp. T6]|uniref:histidine kinase n=1 Tax=Belnapia mucosa TaxID=2804532 RepID=A0ABS1V6T6_9PROT|nr:ATP-binding protein [Belnapia mucosa]MBL6457332.1 response regulator [Belnapia mucosa]
MRISNRLLLIIALCLLPTLALQLILGWTQWAERREQIGTLAIRQAELLAGNVASIAEGARILLGAAAEFRQVRILGADCGARLTALRDHAPGFAFIALLDGGGRVRCASDPTLQTLGERPDWAPAERPAGFTAGRFTRAAGFPGGLLPFYLPVVPGSDQGEGMLVAALDLGWLSDYLIGLKRSGSSLLAAGVLTVADADGAILARDQRHAEFVGQRFPPAAEPLLRASRPGALRLRSLDGTQRIVAMTPPTPASYNLGATVGFSEPELIGDLERALARGALLLGLVAVVAFVLTRLIARRFIENPTAALLAVARRWGAGELSARAPEGNRKSEFGQIGAAWNTMAAQLQRREEELRGHADALEARVEERTRELRAANDRLQREIEERRLTEAALFQAQKMQAVGQLAGGIAHDFNNVLQAVLGGIGLIRRRAGNAEAIQRLSGMVEEAARRGESITRRLLAFSRREELRATVLDVGALLTGLREVLAATLGGRIRVRADVPPDLPPLLADRGQLETVLVNLATNARDAMPGGGTLTLCAEAVRIEAEARGLKPGDYLLLRIADTGEGMSPDVLARAAEPFFTTKPLGQGTGLGLAMAQGFAQGSGGAMAIESRPGEGTVISLWLPAAQAEEAASPPPVPAPARPEASAPRSRRVLLVDDDAVVREVLATQLADAGHAVTERPDAGSALALIEAGERFDLLVTDLAMPGMDGLGLIRAAQGRWPGLPAILLTGYAGDAAMQALGTEAPGRFLLLRKPVTGAELLDRVAAALDGR